jgi:ATP-dependent RNA helicase DeaD
MLEKIDADAKNVQAVVLCPTRELAIQVSGQLNLLGKHMLIKAIPIYGGASYGDQIRGLKNGAQIVVGTPGRMIDHLEKGTLKLENVRTVVLDEADEMISMGFKEDLETILQKIDKEQCNTWLFSATMSASVRKVSNDYLVDPAKVEINRTEVLPSTVEQIYFMTKESNKPEVLCKLIDAAEDFYGMIFCQTKVLVTELTQYLQDRGYRVDCLHGDKSQDARERTMRSFRERKIKVLICTDVASRGVDVKDISHVVNYSLPRELDNYVHRIGRTARSGKTGIAFSLVTPSHRQLVSRIEHRTKSRMTEGKIPNRKDIGGKKIGQYFATFQEKTGFEKAVQLLDDQWKTALASMTTEEVAGRFLSILVPDVFQVDTEAPRMTRPPREDNVDDRPQGRGGYRNGAPSRSFGGGSSSRGGGYERSDRGGYDRGDRYADRGPRKPYSKPAGGKFGHKREDEPVREEPRALDKSQLEQMLTQEESKATVERPRYEDRVDKKPARKFEKPAGKFEKREGGYEKRSPGPARSFASKDRSERPARETREEFKPRQKRFIEAGKPEREPRVVDGDRPHVPFYERRARPSPGQAFGGPKARVKNGKGYAGKPSAGGFSPPKRQSGPA